MTPRQLANRIWLRKLYADHLSDLLAEGLDDAAIATELNRRGVPRRLGRAPWTARAVGEHRVSLYHMLKGESEALC